MGDASHTVRTAPWRHAPALVWREPVLVAVLLALSAVAGFVVATPRLYAGSIAVASLERQLDPLCLGSSVYPSTRSDVTVATPRLARLAAAAPATFGAPLTSRVATYPRVGFSVPPLASGPAGGSAPMAVGTRTGWADHLDLGPGSTGVPEGTAAIPRSVADATGAAPGDILRLQAGDRVSEVVVGGVFPDLTGQALDTYWCSLEPALRAARLLDELVPPPLAMLDDTTLNRVISELDLRTTFRSWEAPIVRDITDPSEADAAARDVVALQEAARTSGSSSGPRASISSWLPFITERAAAMRTSVATGIRPVVVLVLLAAAALLAGAAAFWLVRRRVEVRLLWTRGVAPWLLGVKAGLEVAPPLLLGLVAGWAVAWPVVGALAPGSHLVAGTPLRALADVGVAAVAALALMGLVVTLRVRSAPLGRATGHHRRVPWVVVLGALAVWSFVRLRTLELPVPRGDDLAPVRWDAFVAPIAFLVSATALAVLALRAALRAGAHLAARLPLVPHLAVRRLAAASAVVIALVSAGGLSVGVLVYGAGLAGSAEATVEAKLGVGNGARTAAYLVPAEVPAALDGRATLVRRLDASYAGTDVTLLAVDPATFAEGAYWDPSFATTSLPGLMDALTAPGEEIPVVAVGADLPSAGELSFPLMRARPAAVTVADRADAFPGQAAGVPLLVVDATRLAPRLDAKSPTVWADAEEEEVTAAAGAAGQRVSWATGIGGQVDTSVFQPVIWIFRFVAALGLLVGVLAAVSLLVYLGTGRSARDLAAALLGRMGMGPRQQWSANALELAALAALAVVTGVVTGWMSTLALQRLVDAAPATPPTVVVRFPATVVGVAVLAAVVLVALAATVVTRAASRANLAELLRGDV